MAPQYYTASSRDKIFVQVGSVIPGAGKPLLPRAIVSPALERVSVRPLVRGFAELHYRVPRVPRKPRA